MRENLARFTFSAGTGWVQTASAEDCGRYCDLRISLAPAFVCAQQPLVALASEIEVRLSNRLLVLRHQKEGHFVPFEISLPRDVSPDDSTVKWHRRAHELRISLPWRASATDVDGEEAKSQRTIESKTMTEGDHTVCCAANQNSKVQAYTVFKLPGNAEDVLKNKAPEIDHPVPEHEISVTSMQCDEKVKQISGYEEPSAEADFLTLQRISCFSLSVELDACRENTAGADHGASVSRSSSDGIGCSLAGQHMWKLRNSFLEFTCPSLASSHRRRSQSAGAQPAADAEDVAFARYVNTYHFQTGHKPQMPRTGLLVSGWTPALLSPSQEARDLAFHEQTFLDTQGGGAETYYDFHKKFALAAAANPSTSDGPSVPALDPPQVQMPVTPPSQKPLDVADLLLQHCKEVRNDGDQTTTLHCCAAGGLPEKRRTRRSIKKRLQQPDGVGWRKREIGNLSPKGASISSSKHDSHVTNRAPERKDKAEAVVVNASKLSGEGDQSDEFRAHIPASPDRLKTWQPSLRHRCVAAMHTPSITCC